MSTGARQAAWMTCPGRVRESAGNATGAAALQSLRRWCMAMNLDDTPAVWYRAAMAWLEMWFKDNFAIAVWRVVKS